MFERTLLQYALDKSLTLVEVLINLYKIQIIHFLFLVQLVLCFQNLKKSFDKLRIGAVNN